MTRTWTVATAWPPPVPGRKLRPEENDFIRECMARDWMPGWTGRRAGESIAAATAERLERARTDVLEYDGWAEMAWFAEVNGTGGDGARDKALRFWTFWDGVVEDVTGGIYRVLKWALDQRTPPPPHPMDTLHTTHLGIAKRWDWGALPGYGIDFGGMEKAFPVLLEIVLRLEHGMGWFNPAKGERWEGAGRMAAWAVLDWLLDFSRLWELNVGLALGKLDAGDEVRRGQEEMAATVAQLRDILHGLGGLPEQLRKVGEDVREAREEAHEARVAAAGKRTRLERENRRVEAICRFVEELEGAYGKGVKLQGKKAQEQFLLFRQDPNFGPKLGACRTWERFRQYLSEWDNLKRPRDGDAYRTAKAAQKQAKRKQPR